MSERPDTESPKPVDEGLKPKLKNSLKWSDGTSVDLGEDDEKKKTKPTLPQPTK